MTASPLKVNGRVRPPAMPVLGDWQSLDVSSTATEATETATPKTEPAVEKPDAVAQAEAEAIRARAWAESEERRLAAEAKKEADLRLAAAEADAIRVKAEEEARKMRLATDRAERKEAEEKAASAARIAESNRRRDESDRAREDAQRQAAAQKKTEADQAKAVAKSSERWRHVAMGFYGLCAAVALPVQMAAFYDPHAKYLLVAPVFIEVIALVALVGAAAAVTDGRPQWHYRIVAWVGALTAASINVVHGLDAFDPATAFGTALASLAGPGMWDLHEHGRLRKRDGVLTRRERKAEEKAVKEEARRKATEEKQRQAEKAAADKAAAEAAEELAKQREAEFEDVWKHARKLAAALGETSVTESIWRRAHKDTRGAEPGEDAETLRARNAAEARVEAARQKRPVNTLSKTTNAQRASQVTAAKNPRVYSPPTRRGVRTKGDTKYAPIARNQMSANAKTARPNAN